MKNYHKILVKATKNKTVGNHRVEVYGTARYFYYHNNMVCHVDEVGKEQGEEPFFELDNCGWGEYSSTKNCLAGYREYFSSLGYKEINPIKIYKKD